MTALYTIAPSGRSPEDVVGALRREEARGDQPERPQPLPKEVRAPLSGKELTRQRLVARAAQREGAHIQQRVALTDGAEGLQNQLLAHFPTHSQVLDIIHVREYLWEAGATLCGDTHPERTAWVRAHVLTLLRGQVAPVIAGLEAEAAREGRTALQRQ